MLVLSQIQSILAIIFFDLLYASISMMLLTLTTSWRWFYSQKTILRRIAKTYQCVISYPQYALIMVLPITQFMAITYLEQTQVVKIDTTFYISGAIALSIMVPAILSFMKVRR